MKKFLIAIFASLALVFTGVAAAPIASASPSIEKSVSAIGSFETIKTSGVTIAPPKTIGGGVIKPFYKWLPSSYCYWSGITIREYFCYRYSCTYFEKISWGCYDGYVRMSVRYYT